MSISLTPTPTLVVLPKVWKNDPIIRFKISAETTGDGTGGVVSLTAAFKAANKGLEQYFALTDFKIVGAADTLWYVWAYDDEWDPKEGFTNGELNHVHGGALITFTGTTHYMLTKADSHRFIYLGRPSDAGQGRIVMTLLTNTNLKTYGLEFQGLIFGDRPSPKDLWLYR